MSRLRAAFRAFIDTLRAEPFFGDGDEPMTAESWAGMLILHLEAVHACQHTAAARQELGMAELYPTLTLDPAEPPLTALEHQEGHR